MTSKATQHGISDARTFAEEHPEDVAGALEPGQLGADESLISAMGVAATAKLFGVEPGSYAFTAACDEYNKAFGSELRRRTIAHGRNWTLTVEGEGEHPESLSGCEDEAKAIAWAEKLIRRGDYELADGETTTVRYYLRRGDVQVDRHVEIGG